MLIVSASSLTRLIAISFFNSPIEKSETTVVVDVKTPAATTDEDDSESGGYYDDPLWYYYGLWDIAMFGSASAF